MFNRACVQYDHAAACHAAGVMVIQNARRWPTTRSRAHARAS
jgi:hypothetical protein